MLHTYSSQTELIGLHLSCEGDRTASRVMKSTNPTVRWKPINSQIKSMKVRNGRTPTVNDETTTHTRHPHTPVTLPEPSPPMDLHFPSKTKLSRQILLFAKKSNSTFKFYHHPRSNPQNTLKSNNHKHWYQSVNMEWQKCHFKRSQTLNPLGMAQRKTVFPSPNGHICTPTQSLPSLPTLAVSFSPH